MKIKQQISAAILIAAAALTLTACAPGGVESIGQSAVEASLRGETSWDLAADFGRECKITGTSSDEEDDGEGVMVPVVYVDLDCAGEVEQAQVYLNSAGTRADIMYW